LFPVQDVYRQKPNKLVYDPLKLSYWNEEQHDRNFHKVSDNHFKYTPDNCYELVYLFSYDFVQVCYYMITPPMLRNSTAFVFIFGFISTFSWNI